MRQPHGTTWLNHSYHTGIQPSALHPLQQLQIGASSSSPVQTLDLKLCVQPTVCAQCHRFAGQVGPTRIVTADVMSATLAEAATQLSFAEFLERCNLLRASPPHLQPNPTLLLDAAMQTFSHSAASADVSTQLPLAEFFLGPPHVLSTHPSFTPGHSCADSFTQCRFCRCHHPTAAHGVLQMPVAPHFPNPLTPPLPTVPAAPAAPVTVMKAPRLHAHASNLRHSRLQVSRIMPTCAPHMGSLLKQRRCDPVCVHPPQFRLCSHMCVPPMWEHILYVYQLPTKGVQVPP